MLHMWKSAMCEFVVAMEMSNLGYMFIHSLLVTHKRDSDAAYFHLIFIFNEEQRKII